MFQRAFATLKLNAMIELVDSIFKGNNFAITIDIDFFSGIRGKRADILPDDKRLPLPMLL